MQIFKKKKYIYPECVGCGYCCIRVMCDVGMREHDGWEERCPYLIWKDDKYRCELVLNKIIRWREIAAGQGCSSSLNSWRQDVKLR